mmetsp:Transcript_8891/g.20786  ORF Transcript_8891/g.20786 Transcript_8891/m.20786 type:complete len:157 (-) Transcript_8891:753-1223(-)
MHPCCLSIHKVRLPVPCLRYYWPHISVNNEYIPIITHICRAGDATQKQRGFKQHEHSGRKTRREGQSMISFLKKAAVSTLPSPCIGLHAAERLRMRFTTGVALALPGKRLVSRELKSSFSSHCEKSVCQACCVGVCGCRSDSSATKSPRRSWFRRW